MKQFFLEVESPTLISYTSGSNQYICFLYHNLQFRLPILLLLLLILLKSETIFRCGSAKKVFSQILQNSHGNIKKEIPAQMFSCEF